MIAAPGRPRTACQICKAQKIRCSAERPSCARCIRLKHECLYNEHSVRGNSRRRNLRNFRSKGSKKPTTFQATQSDHNNSASHTQKFRGQVQVSFPTPDENENVNLAIPESLIPDLVELYFENVYQSDLLLHKASFTESLNRGSFSSHVLLSVCAWGAKFYRDSSGFPSLRDNGSMVEWAKRAGKLVFQEVEGFRQDNLVTFFNLAMFWHSQGNWRLSFLDSGNACQLLHIAGLGNQTSTQNNSLDCEIRRRRFWACYLMHCFSPDKLFNFEVIADIETLALPWTEAEFEAGFSQSPSTCLRAGGGNGGVFAQVLQGVRLWSSVASLIKRDDPTGSNRLANILALDEKISVWWTSVPAQFKLTASDVGTIEHRGLQNLLLINALYHQSLCALHASVIPLFSWDASEGQWRTARQSSAQVAFEHASTLSSIIDAVISVHPRPGSMPSFVAYAAYSGCAIQIPFMWSTANSVKTAACHAVNANYRMLHAMADEWKLASILRLHVHCLLDIHKTNPTLLKGEPKDCDIPSLIDCKFNATLARTSVLAFGGILRSKQRGYVESGQECQDLGIQTRLGPDTLNGETRSTAAQVQDSTNVGVERTTPMANPGLPHKDTLLSNEGQIAVDSIRDQVRSQETHVVSSSSKDSQQLSPETVTAQLFQEVSPQGLALDIFNPFSDPEMSSLSFNAETFDFSMFDVDLMNQDFLDIESAFNDGICH